MIIQDKQNIIQFLNPFRNTSIKIKCTSIRVAAGVGAARQRRVARPGQRADGHIARPAVRSRARVRRTRPTAAAFPAATRVHRTPRHKRRQKFHF